MLKGPAMRIFKSLIILLLTALPATAADMDWVKVSDDNQGFVLAESGQPFIPWGFNYDHEEDGKLIEDYWDDQWPTVESAFREMKGLGANIVRIHLQFGTFMESPTEPRQNSLQHLARLVKLAEARSRVGVPPGRGLDGEVREPIKHRVRVAPLPLARIEDPRGSLGVVRFRHSCTSAVRVPCAVCRVPRLFSSEPRP